MTDAGKIWELARGFHSCMLVTRQGADLRSRPMAPIVSEEDNRIYFLARRTGAKDEEIAEDSAVNLAFSDGGKTHLSISGAASVSSDVALKKRLWGVMSQAYVPEGPNADDAIAIVVTPGRAQYWEGDNSLAQIVELGAALVQGRAPDLGDNAKATL